MTDRSSDAPSSRINKYFDGLKGFEDGDGNNLDAETEFMRALALRSEMATNTVGHQDRMGELPRSAPGNLPASSASSGDLPAVPCVAGTPVAWMYLCSNPGSSPVLFTSRQDWADSGSGLWTETPLYAAPVAATPNTTKDK